MENILNITTSELIAILSALPAIVLSVIIMHVKFLSKLRKSFAFDGQFFLIGLVMAIVATIALLNWTTYETYDDFVVSTLEEETDISVQIPTSVHVKKKKLPPPVKKKIQPLELKKIMMVDVKAVEDVEVIDVDPTEDMIEPPPEPGIVQSEPAPIVEPVIVEEDDNGFITIAEQMPRFPGCEHLDIGKKEKEACAKKAMLEYVIGQLKYPIPARENSIEGLVVVQFIVDQTGYVKDVTIVRDIGGGCGKEAVRVVKKMNDMPMSWIPGKQRGRAVNVKYTLPVHFRLD